MPVRFLFQHLDKNQRHHERHFFVSSTPNLCQFWGSILLRSVWAVQAYHPHWCCKTCGKACSVWVRRASCVRYSCARAQCAEAAMQQWQSVSEPAACDTGILGRAGGHSRAGEGWSGGRDWQQSGHLCGQNSWCIVKETHYTLTTGDG